MKYSVDLPPKACPRPRVTRSGHAYYPSGYDQWMDKAVAAINAQVTRIQDGPCTVMLVVRPKGFEVEISDGFDRPKGIRGDLDNITKALLDALVEGGALSDDGLVTSLSVLMEG